MAWFKVDEKIHAHPKVRRLGRSRLQGMGLWLLCAAWCSDNRTDGFVPRPVARQFDAKSRTSDRLVAAGLWKVVEPSDSPTGEPGYRFHDWADHQRTRAQIDSLSRSRQEAGQRGGLRSGEVRRSKAEANASPVASKQTNPDTDTDTDTEPTFTDVEVGASRKRDAARARGTRIPDDFEVTPELVAWARENTPTVDGRAETAKFVDYWRAKAGKDAVKRDWPGTWRNWMRRAQENAPAPRRNGYHAARPTADDKIAALQAMKTGGQPPLPHYALPPGGDPC